MNNTLASVLGTPLSAREVRAKVQKNATSKKQFTSSGARCLVWQMAAKSKRIISNFPIPHHSNVREWDAGLAHLQPSFGCTLSGSYFSYKEPSLPAFHLLLLLFCALCHLAAWHLPHFSAPIMPSLALTLPPTVPTLQNV